MSWVLVLGSRDVFSVDCVPTDQEPKDPLEFSHPWNGNVRSIDMPCRGGSGGVAHYEKIRFIHRITNARPFRSDVSLYAQHKAKRTVSIEGTFIFSMIERALFVRRILT